MSPFQNLVIGTDASGDPIKSPEKLVINVINNTMATMSEKIRLLLILVMSQAGKRLFSCLFLRNNHRCLSRLAGEQFGGIGAEVTDRCQL